MEQTVHLRKYPDSYFTLCGLGYSWPSSIALRNEVEEGVTCKECLARSESNDYKARMGQS